MTKLRALSRLLARTSLIAGTAIALAQPAFAQEAADNSGGNEIIVTAQRRADDHAAVARLRLQNRRAP